MYALTLRPAALLWIIIIPHSLNASHMCLIIFVDRYQRLMYLWVDFTCTFLWINGWLSFCQMLNVSTDGQFFFIIIYLKFLWSNLWWICFHPRFLWTYGFVIIPQFSKCLGIQDFMKAKTSCYCLILYSLNVMHRCVNI